MRKKRIFVLAVVILLVLPSMALAGSISGKVQVEGTAKPASGISLALMQWHNGYWSWIASMGLDAEGKFKFTNLEAGTYSIYFFNSYEYDMSNMYIEEYYKDVGVWAPDKRTGIELAENQDLNVGVAKVKLRPFYVKEYVLEPGEIVSPKGGDLTLKATIVNTTGKAASLFFWGNTFIFTMTKNDYFGLDSVFPMVEKFKQQLNPGENVLEVPVTVQSGFPNGWNAIMLYGGISYLQPRVPGIYALFCKGTEESCAEESPPQKRPMPVMPVNNWE